MRGLCNPIVFFFLCTPIFYCGKSWGKFWTSEPIYSIKGTITNLTKSGLVLTSNLGETLNIASNAVSFVLTRNYRLNETYSISILTPPSGQACILSNGSGTISGDVTNVNIACFTSASFDTSFGGGLGYKQIGAIAGYATALDMAEALALDSSDRIVVVGQSQNSTPATVMITCRFNADGSIDTTFATAAITPGCASLLVGVQSVGYGIGIDSSTGKIYSLGQDGMSNMLMARYTTSGTLDASFNGTGYVTHNVGAANEGRTVAVDSSGRPVLTGRGNCSGTCDWMVWRFTTAGVLDTTFNGTGFVQSPGNYATAFDILLQNDGQILVAGTLLGQANLRRYNTNGSLDNSFNGTGIYAFPNGSYLGTDYLGLARDSSGNIFVAGDVQIAANDQDMALWKIKSNGVLDTTFNSSGYITHANAAQAVSNPIDLGEGVAVDAFGRIIVSGVSCNNLGYDSCFAVQYKGYSIVIWRYLANGAPDTSFNNGSHFKIVDSNLLHQNVYTTRINLKLDSLGRIVIAAFRDNDAPGTGDGSDLRIYRLWN